MGSVKKRKQTGVDPRLIAEYQDCKARGDIQKARRIADGICRTNGGLVNRVVQKYSPFLGQSRTTEWEDLSQSGMIGLFNAIQSYNPERGAFSTYATFKILHEVQCAVRKDRLVAFPKNNGKAPVEWTADVTNLDFEEDDGLTSFFSQVMQREDLIPVLCRISNPDEREAVISVCSGVSVADTSKQLAMKPQAVLDALEVFRRELEAHGEEYGDN